MYRALYVKGETGLGYLVSVVPIECKEDLGENNPLQIVRFVQDVLKGVHRESLTVDFGSLEHVTDVWDVETA